MQLVEASGNFTFLRIFQLGFNYMLDFFGGFFLTLGRDRSEIHSLASKFKPFYLKGATGILRDKSISFSRLVYLTALLMLITLQVTFGIAVKPIALEEKAVLCLLATLRNGFF